MVSLQPPICDFGWKARDFDLPGVDGRRHNVASARGKNGLLVMFICNHCPYVKSIRERIVRDTCELQQHGVNSIAIMSNRMAATALGATTAPSAARGAVLSAVRFQTVTA